MSKKPPVNLAASVRQRLLNLSRERGEDFYDLHVISRRLDSLGPALARAIRETFRRRQTEIPKATPMGLSEEFASDMSKRSQWRGFLRWHELPEDVTLGQVLEDVRAFLMPPASALVEGNAFERTWPAGGPWQAS